MAYEFKAIRRVEFADTDMAGIMHYSNFFPFYGNDRTRFFPFARLVRLLRTKLRPAVGWPRVHARCDFKSPLCFEDEVEIHLLVSEKKSKALSYLFKFRKLNASPPVEVARGALTVVCVRHRPDGTIGRLRDAPLGGPAQDSSGSREIAGWQGKLNPGKSKFAIARGPPSYCRKTRSFGK